MLCHRAVFVRLSVRLSVRHVRVFCRVKISSRFFTVGWKNVFPVFERYGNILTGTA